VVPAHLPQRGRLAAAAFPGVAAARVEGATRRQVGRVGDVASQADARPLLARLRVGHRHRRHERYPGYLEACQEAGPPTTPLAVIPDGINVMIESGRALLHQWLKPLLDGPEPPTAIFCTGDHYANAVLIALNNLGIQVPTEMSVASFDNINIASMLIPALTTVYVNTQAIGYIATERLLARINGDDSPRQKITVGTQLVVRNSAAAVPAK
jgi:DNA-binding LacI/PurR family transcriptional regulator